MGAQIEFVKGNMFDGPSDLVVIPCSTIPTITWFVAEHLRAFNIPAPHGRMSLGQVVFAELREADNIAQIAAYVASVHPSRGASAEVIERIGRQLGIYAAENQWLSQISCPLIGTGAGRMDPISAVRALAAGYLATAPDRAVLRIFVLDTNVFRKIQSLPVTALSQHHRTAVDVARRTDRHPRVFISYTKSSDDHTAWVKSIASALRAAGIDARMDIWHLRPGMDVAQWMCNELDLADRVLLVCDELYARKADGRHGGVGWEIRVIQGDLMQSQATNPDKFVPVIATEDIADGMPTFIKAVYCIHWPPSKRNDATVRDDLIKTIYRAQEEAPPLGPPAYAIRRT